MLSCCNFTVVEGEKPHPASYWGYSHAKELRRRRAERAPKESSGRTFLSKFTSPEQSYSAAPRQDTQHQKQQACGLLCCNIGHNMKFREHICQKRLGRTESSSDNEQPKPAIVVRQIMTVRSEAVTEKHKIMCITHRPVPCYDTERRPHQAAPLRGRHKERNKNTIWTIQ
jgi:hypothetical protein